MRGGRGGGIPYSTVLLYLDIAVQLYSRQVRHAYWIVYSTVTRLHILYHIRCIWDPVAMATNNHGDKLIMATNHGHRWRQIMATNGDKLIMATNHGDKSWRQMATNAKGSQIFWGPQSFLWRHTYTRVVSNCLKSTKRGHFAGCPRSSTFLRFSLFSVCAMTLTLTGLFFVGSIASRCEDDLHRVACRLACLFLLTVYSTLPYDVVCGA